MESNQALSLPNGVTQVFGGLLSFRSPFEIWQNNWIMLCLELPIFIVTGFIDYQAWKHDKHAFHYGLACALSIMYAELSIFILPSSRSWWYEHFMISFFKGNIPLILPMTYIFIYSSSIIFSKSLKLPKIIEAWMSSILVFLLAIHIDHFGADQGLWTFHSTDPAFKERFLTVPWDDIFLLSLVAINMCLISDKLLMSSFPRYLIMRILVSGFVAGFLSYIQYVTAYVTLCWVLGGSNILVGFIVPMALTVILYVFKPELWTTYSKHSGESPIKHKVFKWCIIFLATTSIFLFIADPGNSRLIGPHQSIGPCKVQESLINQILIPVVREKYICVNGSRELDTWDFHCLSADELDSLRNQTTNWYPICGKPFENRANFIFASLIPTTTWVALVYQIILNSIPVAHKNGKIE